MSAILQANRFRFQAFTQKNLLHIYHREQQGRGIEYKYVKLLLLLSLTCCSNGLRTNNNNNNNILIAGAGVIGSIRESSFANESE